MKTRAVAKDRAAAIATWFLTMTVVLALTLAATAARAGTSSDIFTAIAKEIAARAAAAAASGAAAADATASTASTLALPGATPAPVVTPVVAPAAVPALAPTLAPEKAAPPAAATIGVQELRKVIGNPHSRGYNPAKVNKALSSKVVTLDLVNPTKGQYDSDGLSLPGLRGTYFTCADMPDGFPKGKASYRVTSKILKFSVEDDVEGDVLGVVHLEKCRG